MTGSPHDPFDSLVARACSALDAASADGVQPLTADATFEHVVPLPELRGIALDRKLDMGFDAGPERFATFLTLRLCRRWLRWLPNVTAAAARFAGQTSSARHNFYLQPNTFPYDADTTSVGSAGLFEAGLIDAQALANSAGELRKARYLAENVRATRYLPIPRNAGVVMVYWLDGGALPSFFARPQFDPAVAANALYAAYLAAEHGAPELTEHFEPTFRYVADHLASGRYLEGTLYYPSPDSFLCLLGLLLARFPRRLSGDLAAALRQALALREKAASDDPVHDPRSALNRAQRIIAADALALADGRELVDDLGAMKRALAEMQGADALWDAGALYGYGRMPFFIGSRELTAVYAISALGRGAFSP